MKHSADEDIVKNKMKLTFDYRRNMILDPQQSCNILFEFPRFKDVKGLVEQDFVLMFGEGVSGSFWRSGRPHTRKRSSKNAGSFHPPGRRKPGKVSASQAEKHLVVFKKSGTSIQEHLDAITTSSQPYLLAVGARKNAVHQFFIVLDKNAIPCRSTSCLGAFDELFKAHFVFGTSYNPMLRNMYTFIQTTVYNIDVGKVKESPRVAEVRAQRRHYIQYIHLTCFKVLDCAVSSQSRVGLAWRDTARRLQKLAADGRGMGARRDRLAGTVQTPPTLHVQTPCLPRANPVLHTVLHQRPLCWQAE
ncbi:hypothetical protein AAFF_G00090390 [Aldrovandia affinis]|uniref:Uncharacterized protein n=1 Tax=Aldrovandia affinis TaxID=143900 RepID=A0AAD7WCY9_9TELE|nr:hypothetical protein AAFF_G00090390 [Aldrovandia affinis]